LAQTILQINLIFFSSFSPHLIIFVSQLIGVGHYVPKYVSMVAMFLCHFSSAINAIYYGLRYVSDSLVRFLALATTMVTTVDHGNHRSNDRGNNRDMNSGWFGFQTLPFFNIHRFTFLSKLIKSFLMKFNSNFINVFVFMFVKWSHHFINILLKSVLH